MKKWWKRLKLRWSLFRDEAKIVLCSLRKLHKWDDLGGLPDKTHLWQCQRCFKSITLPEGKNP
jgi:hypothetical protein